MYHAGARVDQLSSLIHKLLPHANGLRYTNHPSSPQKTVPPSSTSTPHPHLTNLPRITGVVSHLGERLELHQVCFTDIKLSNSYIECLVGQHLPLQGVPCAGTVESIITSLFSSLRSTLRSQLSSAMTSLIPTSGAPPSTPLSLLPSLWSSQLSTQIVLLATHISLDMALEAALQCTTDTGEGVSLDGLCEEIHQLVEKAVAMLQGHHLPPEHSHSVESDSTAKQEESILEERVAVHVSITRNQANRLRSVLFILNYGLHLAVECLQQRSKEAGRECEGGELSDFHWQGRLRWVWSGGASSEGECHVTTIGARLSYGYHYVGSGSHLVLTPTTEKALAFILKTVHQGHHSLLTGPEVRVYRRDSVYVYKFIFPKAT